MISILSINQFLIFVILLHHFPILLCDIKVYYLCCFSNFLLALFQTKEIQINLFEQENKINQSNLISVNFSSFDYCLEVFYQLIPKFHQYKESVRLV